MGRLTEMVAILECDPKKLTSIKPFIYSYSIPYDISRVRRDHRKSLLSDLPLSENKDEHSNKLGLEKTNM